MIYRKAPFYYFDDSMTDAKMAFEGSMPIVGTMPAAAIVMQTTSCESREKEIGPMIHANSPGSISIREIQQTVALAFNLSVRDMVSPSRRRHVTNARHVAMYLSREMAARRQRPSDLTVHSSAPIPPSFPRIGLAFARDHSSVIHACTMVKRRLRDDLGFAMLLNRLAGDLRDHALAAVSTREAI